MGWEVLFPIYSALLLLTVVILNMTRITENMEKASEPATFRSSFVLLSDPFILLMVIGIFLYVGAEVSISSGIPLLLEEQFGIDIQKLGVAGSGFFFIAIMTGRFLGSVILNWIRAKVFLLITSILSLLAIGGLFSGNETLTIISIFIVGLGFANIFPLIFSITVDRTPERANELSGLMVTAIVGGAILPLIMGFVADITSLIFVIIVPMLAIVYVLYVALRTMKTV